MKHLELGQIVMTAAVAAKMDEDSKFSKFVSMCLGRYSKNDWGTLDEEDWKLNDESLEDGERILASYPLPKDIHVDGEDKLWIITEWDRSVTTILFPGDY